MAKKKKKRIETELIKKKIGRELIALWPILSGIQKKKLTVKQKQS